MIYLFVLDDSLTNTTRTEELTKCYEPLQKMRLWPCKIDLSPSVITDRSKAIFL